MFGRISISGFICIYILLVERVQESTQQIIIEKLIVPPFVEAGENTSVILDCIYNLNNSTTKDLMVKWWLDGDKLLYQWIYGYPPAVNNEVYPEIEENFSISNDPLSKYRALKINNVNTSYTGEYSCHVSSWDSDVRNSTRMTVYSTEETFDLKYEKMSDADGEEVVEVTCVAEGLYPEPTLDISVNDRIENSTDETEAMLWEDSSTYNISTILFLNQEEFSHADIIECRLSIPKANYTNTKYITLAKGKPTGEPFVTTNMLRKMDIQAINNTDPNTNNGGGGTTPTLSTSLIMVVMLLLSSGLLH